MASNDSNEPGNDTAAGPAFQVGDRVRWGLDVAARAGEGTVKRAVHQPNADFVIVVPDGQDRAIMLLSDGLTLIARATPTPVPAQPAPERNSFAMTMPCQFGKHGECDGTLRVGNVATPDVVSSPCECECHQHSEPAVDPHTLDLEILARCRHCDGVGFEWDDATTCGECGGSGSTHDTIRLSGEAVDRLAAALAARMRSVAR